MQKPKKLTTDEVAVEYRRHPVTVRIALNAGELHGTQRIVGGRWLIDEKCAEAWADGMQCEHMIEATAAKRGGIPLLRAS